jgi:hypothetical protein
MTASFKKEGKFGPKKVKKVNGPVFVLVVLCLHVSMIFFIVIWRSSDCVVFVFVFHFIITIDSNKQINIILQLTL